MKGNTSHIDLIDESRLTNSIVKSMDTILKGNVQFTERIGSWVFEVKASWNGKYLFLQTKSRKSNLKSNFVACELSHFHFLTILSCIFCNRADTYKFKGRKSEFSELLFKSVTTPYLLDCKNATLGLSEQSLFFKGGIRKRDSKSLFNLFRLIEMLMEEIDGLIHIKSREDLS